MQITHSLDFEENAIEHSDAVLVRVLQQEVLAAFFVVPTKRSRTEGKELR